MLIMGITADNHINSQLFNVFKAYNILIINILLPTHIRLRKLICLA